MEILRGIYDQADVGLVIAGEPALEAQIKTYLLAWRTGWTFTLPVRP